MSLSRFCATCGTPATDGSTHCARCGTVLAIPPPDFKPGHTTAEQAAARRSGIPSWLIGVVACMGGGFLFLVCGGVIAAIAVPSFMGAAEQSKALSAKSNLEAIWAAERAWAAAHDGDFLEFYVDQEDASDANFRRLGVALSGTHHAYEGYYDGDTFYVIATGNLDEDDSTDEWELSSDDGIAVQLYDDVREISNYGYSSSSNDDEGDEEEEETLQGGTAMGGLITTSSASSEAEAKSATARANLTAIWEAQRAYRLSKKKFLPFEGESESAWLALGLDRGLPEASHHTYAARLDGAELTIHATGNLDADPFLDEWTLSSSDGVPVQVKNDSVDLDLTELAGILKELAKEQPK